MTAFFTALAANRITYVVVLVLGMALCTRGIGQAAARNLWANPISIAGYLLGALASLLGLQGIFRFNLIPLQGSLLLAGIVAIVVLKIILALGYRGFAA